MWAELNFKSPESNCRSFSFRQPQEGMLWSSREVDEEEEEVEKDHQQQKQRPGPSP